MSRYTAPITIRDYRDAFRAANGTTAPRLDYRAGWFTFSGSRAHYRERDILAMADRLRERAGHGALVEAEPTPRPAAAPAEDNELRETIARAICDVWEYLWDGDPDEDDQVAPEVTVGYDTRPSKELYREAANTILPIIHAREADTARQLAEAHEQIVRLKGERDATREALRPFVFGDPVMEDILWGRFPDDKSGTITTNLGAFRRARAVLAASGDGGERAE